jgi:hypothetical protein
MTAFAPFHVKTSTGIPIEIRHHDCAWCQSRTKHGETWVEADERTLRLRRRTSSHGICPPCAAKERAAL